MKDVDSNTGTCAAFRAMIARMHEGALLLGVDGTILYCNPRAAEMLRQSETGLVGTALAQHLGAQRADFETMLVATPAGEQCREFQLIGDSNVRIPVSLLISAIDDTSPGQLCAVMTDLTTQRQHERMRQSELRFREVAQALPQIIWTTQANGKPDFMNEHWAKYTGISVQEAMEGEGLRSAVHPDDWSDMFAKWRAAVRDGQPLELEHRLRRHDGSWRWHLGRAVPVRDENGRFQKWLGTTTDIESQKQAEVSLKSLAEHLEQRIVERTAQLRDAAAEIARVEQRERRRLAQALHDHLQQLLVTARLKVSMARDRSTEDGQGQQLLADVDELLHTTIEASRDLAVDLSPPVLHERGLAEGLNWLGRRFIAQHNFQVDVDLQMSESTAHGLPEPLRDFLFHSARELLFNAVKHANCARASLTLAATPEGLVELSVTDEGDGVVPDALDGKGDGTGMGLSSMRQRVELWGGQLELEAGPGCGFHVRLRLPIPLTRLPSPEAPAGPSSEQPPVAVPVPQETGTSLRILLADDHAVLRDGLAGLLRQHGFAIVGEAADGQQAIDLALALQPEVVLMDISMPNVDGIDATRAICERAPHVRVIGLSMHDDTQVADAMRDAGACNFVTKNSPSEQLIAAIRNSVRESAVS